MNLEIRLFRRSDRDQLAALVNAHVEVVVPGGAIPVNSVLTQLEREPGEFIVDPWVAERMTLVGEQTNGIVAAALLHRYRTDADVPERYRGAGEIRWLVFMPLRAANNAQWHDGNAAAVALISHCEKQFRDWQCAVVYADGALPSPGVYGVPEQWPHVAALYRNAGFAPSNRESVYLADLAAIAPPRPTPGRELRIHRSVGINGVRFTATSDSTPLGYIEVERQTGPDRRSGPVVADIGNLWVIDGRQRNGIGTLLLQHAAAWLRLGCVDLLLAYASPDTATDGPMRAFLASNEFALVTTTERGWTRT